eukprot:154262-Chlamydomonas_euryale.AAC.1
MEAHKDAHMMAELFALDDDEIPFPHETYPLSYAILQQEQKKDATLHKRVRQNSDKYTRKTFTTGRKTFKLYVTKDERIVIPASLQRRTVK